MSQAVTKMEAQQVPAPVTEGAAVLQMIERAARDPGVDINKLQQLMEMKVQMEARAAERDFDVAMSEAQSEMRRVAVDSNNPQTKSKYASYAALDRELRPIYTANGFSLSFNTGAGAADMVRVVCRVAHRGGHAITYHVDMPADGKGAKGGDVMTKTHATGAAITYGMRYLLKMIFNIAVGQDDDDGNSATGVAGPISEEQASNLRGIIEEVGADIRKFCAYFKIEAVPDLPAGRYQDAVRLLSQKKGAKR